MSEEWQDIIDFSAYAGEALKAKICSCLKEIIEYDLIKNRHVFEKNLLYIESKLSEVPNTPPEMSLENMFLHNTAHGRIKIYGYALRSYLASMSKRENSFIRLNSEEKYSSSKYENFTSEYNVELVAGGNVVDYTTLSLYDIVLDILKIPLSRMTTDRKILNTMIENQISINNNNR